MNLHREDDRVGSLITRGNLVSVKGLAGQAIVADYWWHGSELTVRVNFVNSRGFIVASRVEPGNRIVPPTR